MSQPFHTDHIYIQEVAFNSKSEETPHKS